MDQQFTQLITRSGLTLRVRPVRPGDEAALAKFFEEVTAEDRRFRFLSVVRVGREHVAAMTQVDHHQTESYVALDETGTTILGTAMLACDPMLETGEVAISVRGDQKNRGIGWELLRHVERQAEARGVKRLMSIENCANKSAIQIEREMGFDAHAYDGDMTLVVLQKGLAA
ncbi:GNAT family N-acetyltransferase [Devosia sediminis]|uniref:GNAT family N-acetyltransferase n=1 Tax=Devosia sediminis TaxID=2798801 RepID=A0A934MJP9_9HYPH|nr:GNAT family N-acetyltransferase [Devosia sediminis]MBJ3784293.1 GNAT family N-acetyltransferase [Devosia sediminis]